MWACALPCGFLGQQGHCDLLTQPSYSQGSLRRQQNSGASSSDFLEGKVTLQTKIDYPEGECLLTHGGWYLRN